MNNLMQLPQRGRDELNRMRYNSELLVAAVQLSVVVLLAIINYITPVSYTATASVHSAPLGLCLFTILILVRLWFAYTKQLTPFILGLSVVAEMLLLLFIIWTYYLQFETTPVINLKNPIIFFVFVLIALRALRFEPQWVVLSGVVAAIGWSAIVWHTIYVAGMNVITWDYVTYASTRSVYIAAEFVIVLSILLVTGIISLGLQRTHAMVYKLVHETIAVQDLSKFFDSDVANKITMSENVLQAGYGEKRDAAILFIDIRGFTQFSENRSPRDLIALLREYQNLMVPIIQQHNGTIDKFMGDGILASFGAIMPTSSYAADALNAVDTILQAAERWKIERIQANKAPVNIGVGLSCGQVLFGVIGSKERLEYTLIGEPVNLAAKLEKQNKVEHTRMVTTPAFLTKALEQHYVDRHDKQLRAMRTVSGINDPMDLLVMV